MNLLTHLMTSVRRLFSQRDLETIAHQWADRLEQRAWRLVQKRAGTLSRYEARGYLRARTTMLLDESVQPAGISEQARKVVCSLVLAELTRRLHSQLVQTPVTRPLRVAA